MKINLKKAVKAFHPNASFMQVYFEAVANAIDAGADKITISVTIEAFDKPDTLRVDICDNGAGFTDENFRKFARLLEVDSNDHKGLGRLVYLAYFNKVEIVSQFEERQARSFRFDNSFDETKYSLAQRSGPRETRLQFCGFLGARFHSYESLTPEGIKAALLNEFMPTFFARRKLGKELLITIELVTSKPNHEQGFVSGVEILTSSELPHFKTDTFRDPSLDFFQGVEIHYSIENDLAKNKSALTFVCVDGRAVPMDLLHPEAIPGGHQVAFFFMSDYFVGKTNVSRQKLELPDEVTENSLKASLRREVGRILAAELPQIEEQNKKTEIDLNQRYPHLVGYFPHESAGLIVRTKSLEEAQRAFFNEQKAILECEMLNDQSYEKAVELSARSLMEYVLYRAQIIQKLKALNPKAGEDTIHDIIVPTKRSLVGSMWIDDAFTNNVWLLDDRYMSYSTILSDQHMTELLNHLEPSPANDETRPDIAIVFSANPNEQDKVSVVVVELKKKGLKLAKMEEVISQLRQRARKLLEYYPSKLERIWFFGVTEITPEFRRAMKEDEFREMFSHGQLFYKQQPILLNDDGPAFPVDLVIMNYEAMIHDAEARNETFMKLLRNRIAHFVSSSS